MKKIIYSLSFLILSAALPASAFAADMHCFYKSSGKNIITVCKKNGNLYYDSLADVLSEFVSNSGIRSGEAYNFSTVQDKNGDNPKVADYISKNLFAKLSHAGIKADKDVNSKISAAFEITGSNMEILFNVPDKNYSEKLILFNAEAIKEDAEIYAVNCPETIKCPVVSCPEPKCPSRINLTEEIAKFFPNKWLYVVCSGLGIMLLVIIINAIFKPTYPSNLLTIWFLILMLIFGLGITIFGLFGLAMPSWSWPLCATSAAITTLGLVLGFIFVRNMGLFRRP